MLYLVILALVVVAVCVAFPFTRRDTRLDDVYRFDTARALTTTWAAQPRPTITSPAQGDDDTD